MLDADVCRHFLRRGGCLYGADCRFKHDSASLPELGAQCNETNVDAAFTACENRVNTLRRAGAPKQDLMEAVRELEALKAERRHQQNGAVQRRSRYATRRRLQNDERSGIFRQWLCEMYGTEVLRGGSGVLDVAGGRGGLGFELVNVSRIPCTVIDPRPIEPGLARLERKWRIIQGIASGGAELLSGGIASGGDAAALSERSRAARQVHVEWREAHQAMVAMHSSLRRPAHWRLCWRRELWEGVASKAALRTRPANDELAALNEQLMHWQHEARAMQWTKKGLVQGSDEGERADDVDVEAEEEIGAGEAAALDKEAGRLHACDVWEVLAKCSLVAGMHPDQPTEAIVDFALATGKPFAVVPCCVYSAAAAGGARRDASTGLRVGRMSYPKFLQYLVAKAPTEIRMATLPFEGKNVVVYRQPSPARSDEQQLTASLCGLCSESEKL